MYFPILNTMRSYRVDEFLAHKLDVWLGTRRKAVRKYLSPIQFSLDTQIDEEISISLFVICTEQNIQLLSPKYVIECTDNCYSTLGVFSDKKEIPPRIYCYDCEREVQVHKDMITIWFELTQEPVEQPFQEISNRMARGEVPAGKNWASNQRF